MPTSIDELLDQYERGGLSRRQLIRGLLLLAVPSTVLAQAGGRSTPAPPAPSAAIAPARSLNHVNFSVSNMDRSLEFYQAVLGATERGRTGPTHVTMRLPNSTKQVGSFLSLTTKEGAGTYDHIGIGVDWTAQRTPEKVAEAIHKMFPQVKPPQLGADSKPGGRRVDMMIYDPDGLPVQLMGLNDDGWECPGVTPQSCA